MATLDGTLYGSGAKVCVSINPAQRKIPVVFNRGQKIGPISGRSKKSPTFGQIIVLIYGRHLYKACGASPLV